MIFRGDLDFQNKTIFGFQSPESVFKLTFDEKMLTARGADRHFVRISTCSDKFDDRRGGYMDDTEVRSSEE